MEELLDAGIEELNIPQNNVIQENNTIIQEEELGTYINSNTDEFDDHSVPIFDEHEECYLPQHEIYLKKRNYFSEFSTESEKAKVRLALGIGDSLLLIWDNITGEIQNNAALTTYVQNSITWKNLKGQIADNEQLQTFVDERTSDKIVKEIPDGSTASKQIKYAIKNSDFSLNENYKQAINKFGEINSIDDALAVIMHSLFPVDYINWAFSLRNSASKEYSFEKGSTLTVNGNDTIGNIVITAIPGNMVEQGDYVSKFKVNDNIVFTDKDSEFSYTIAVKASDVLGSQLTYQTSESKTKNYTFSMETAKLQQPITQTATATVAFKTKQYYFYLSSSTPVTSTQFSGASISAFKSESLTSSVYALGNSKKYLYLLSPKEVTQVETTAATTSAGAQKGSFSVTTAWEQKQVTYTPIAGGTNQTYWLVTLNGQQSNYVRIKITTK